MEFGFEPVCDQLRLEQVRVISTCRNSSNLLKACRRQVRSWFEAGRRQARTSFEPDSVMEFGFTHLLTAPDPHGTNGQRIKLIFGSDLRLLSLTLCYKTF